MVINALLLGALNILLLAGPWIITSTNKLTESSAAGNSGDELSLMLLMVWKLASILVIVLILGNLLGSLGSWRRSVALRRRRT